MLWLGLKWALQLLLICDLNADGDSDPGPIFINPEVQGMLQALTRVDYDRVFRRRKLGTTKLSDPEYKFMTDEELQQAMRAAKERAEELLQIPPVVKARSTEAKLVCKDPELQGNAHSTISCKKWTDVIKSKI